MKLTFGLSILSLIGLQLVTTLASARDQKSDLEKIIGIAGKVVEAAKRDQRDRGGERNDRYQTDRRDRRNRDQGRTQERYDDRSDRHQDDRHRPRRGHRSCEIKMTGGEDRVYLDGRIIPRGEREALINYLIRTATEDCYEIINPYRCKIEILSTEKECLIGTIQTARYPYTEDLFEKRFKQTSIVYLDGRAFAQYAGPISCNEKYFGPVSSGSSDYHALAGDKYNEVVNAGLCR